jgi:hypothetical protein
MHPDFQIKRDPIREALRQLVRDDVLEGWGQPYKGTDGHMHWLINPALGDSWYGTTDEVNDWLGELEYL